MRGTVRLRHCLFAAGLFAAVWFVDAEVREVPLIEATKKSDVQAVSTLLAHHADPNGATPDGATALFFAAEKGNLAIANLLLKAGANAKAANRYGFTALTLACINGDAAMIEKLLNAGADANTASAEGETALMTAARTGNAEAVQALVLHGADVNAREKWRGQTALQWAANEGNAAAVRALLKAGADRNARTDPSASRNRASSGAGNFTPFLLAVRQGNLETVQVLLEAGSSPNESLSSGQTALHIATANANYDIGMLLLDKGANPNAAECGWTPLHQVAWTRRPNIHKTPAAIGAGVADSLVFTKALLAHGADINARETKEPRDGNLGKLKRAGATAFLLAAKSGDYEYMRFLGGLGADARLMTNEHVTPLETAAGIGIYRVAESPGSNEDAFESVKAAYEIAKGDAVYVTHVDDNGRTALHGASMRGSPEIVQYLFDRGAGAVINQKDHLGWTALTIAEGVMWPTVMKTELPTAELLAKLGAKHEEVPQEVRMLGMATQGTDNGLDQTQGGGSSESMSAAARRNLSDKPDEFQTSAGAVTITPIQHASALLSAGGRNIYIDPVEGTYEGRPTAGLILITDIHSDHFSPGVIRALQKEGTQVWGPAAVAEKFPLTAVLANGDKKQWGDWSVEAVPAYNRIRGPVALQLYHPKGRGNGYVLSYGGKRFYFSGDTENIPEMEALKNIEAAYLSINLPYTMTSEEAALTAQRFHPAVIYPYHYRGLHPTNLNAFAAYLHGTGIEVRLREWYPKSSK